MARFASNTQEAILRALYELRDEIADYVPEERVVGMLVARNFDITGINREIDTCIDIGLVEVWGETLLYLTNAGEEQARKLRFDLAVASV